MIAHLNSLYRHRDLLIMWTLREIHIRYKQSLLGVAWAVLQPLALMLIFSVVFSLFVRMPSDDIPYPIFAYTALLAWTFQASSLTMAIPSLTNNLTLITKVYFPREILPLATICASFLDFLVAGLLLVPAILLYHLPISLSLIWVPVIVLVQILLLLGVILPASALIVFYRDLRFIVPLAVQMWLYITPIIYPLSLVPEKFRLAYALNPMVGIVDSYRRVLLHGLHPQPEYLLISFIISISLAAIGYTYFKYAERSFADLI